MGKGRGQKNISHTHFSSSSWEWANVQFVPLGHPPCCRRSRHILVLYLLFGCGFKKKKKAINNLTDSEIKIGSKHTKHTSTILGFFFPHLASLIRKLRKNFSYGWSAFPFYGSHDSNLCCISLSESCQNLNAVNISINYSTERAINIPINSNISQLHPSVNVH